MKRRTFDRLYVTSGPVNSLVSRPTSPKRLG